MPSSPKLIYLESVDSTNDYLRRETLPDRSIVYTFHQTAGRGRAGRRWLESAGSNLALSVIFRPEAPEEPFWRVALLALPMAELLRAWPIEDVWIKWPNDIFVGGKKIAGVLAESVFQGGRITKIIAGIGVNLNSTADELAAIGRPATSVRCETGQELDLAGFAAAYLDRLSRIMSERLTQAVIRERWLAGSGMVGRHFTWTTPQGLVAGRVADVDGAGVLMLETAAGIIKITTGDLAAGEGRIVQTESGASTKGRPTAT